jgi:hypothetical protein
MAPSAIMDCRDDPRVKPEDGNDTMDNQEISAGQPSSGRPA